MSTPTRGHREVWQQDEEGSVGSSWSGPSPRSEDHLTVPTCLEETRPPRLKGLRDTKNSGQLCDSAKSHRTLTSSPTRRQKLPGWGSHLLSNLTPFSLGRIYNPVLNAAPINREEGDGREGTRNTQASPLGILPPGHVPGNKSASPRSLFGHENQNKCGNLIR